MKRCPQDCQSDITMTLGLKSRVGKIVGLACWWGLWISGFPHLVCLIVQVMAKLLLPVCRIS